MTEIEKQALALLNEVRRERGKDELNGLNRERYCFDEILCRTIERHEAFRREVSDAVEHFRDQWQCSTPCRDIFDSQFGSFILKKPDPLAETLRDTCDIFAGEDWDGPQVADYFREALAARGLEIVEKKP